MSKTDIVRNRRLCYNSSSGAITSDSILLHQTKNNNNKIKKIICNASGLLCKYTLSSALLLFYVSTVGTRIRFVYDTYILLS